MSKVNMIGSDGAAFTTSLKNSRVHVANGTASLADAPKRAPAKKDAAKKAPTKVAAKRTYSTRAMKAK